MGNSSSASDDLGDLLEKVLDPNNAVPTEFRVPVLPKGNQTAPERPTAQDLLNSVGEKGPSGDVPTAQELLDLASKRERERQRQEDEDIANQTPEEHQGRPPSDLGDFGEGGFDFGGGGGGRTGGSGTSSGTSGGTSGGTSDPRDTGEIPNPTDDLPLPPEGRPRPIDQVATDSSSTRGLSHTLNDHTFRPSEGSSLLLNDFGFISERSRNSVRFGGDVFMTQA